MGGERFSFPEVGPYILMGAVKSYIEQRHV